MYLFELWFSLDICPGMGLLDDMVALFLVFQGTSILFPIVALPVYIPTNSVGWFWPLNFWQTSIKLQPLFLHPGIPSALGALLSGNCTTNCFCFRSLFKCHNDAHPRPPYLKSPLPPSLYSGPPLLNSIFIFSHHLLTHHIIYFFNVCYSLFVLPHRYVSSMRAEN